MKQNEAISNKVDRLKDMVSDRLSEVEVKVNKLFTLGASSEESMRSLAESVSHLKKHFGTFPGTVTVTAPALDAFPWACDAITGIDDAFSRDPVKGMSRCIYCRRVFVWEDLESPARLGRHLVDRHAFGKCNLNVAYKMWEELEDHLANFHSSTPGLKKDRFLRKRLQDPSVLQLDDSLTHPSQGPSADEVTARSLLLLTILEDKLRECGIELLVGRDASSEQRSHHVCSAMARLDLLYRDSMLKSRPPKSVQRLLYEAACIEEEIVLSGDLETLRFSSLYSSDQTFLHQSSSKPSLHGLLYQIEPRWYCDVAKLKKFRFPSDCEDCLSGKRYISRRHTLIHVIMEHQREPEIHRPMLGALDVAARVIVRRPEDKSARSLPVTTESLRMWTCTNLPQVAAMHHINNWLFETFIKSVSLRRMLHSGQTGVGALYATPVRNWHANCIQVHWTDGTVAKRVERHDDLSSRSLHKHREQWRTEADDNICKSTRSHSHFDGSVDDAVFEDDDPDTQHLPSLKAVLGAQCK